MSRLLRRHLLLGPIGMAGACAEETNRSSERVSIGPGPGVGEQIQAALDAGYQVQLERGTFALAAPLQLGSGARLFGAGRGLTRLLPLWVADPAFADEATNAMIIASSQVDPDPVGYLSAAAPKDSRSLLIDGTLPVSGWLQMQGANNGADEYEMSDGINVVLTEIVEVASVQGSIVSVVDPTRQFHAPNTPVRVVHPIEDIFLSGFDLEATDSLTATGILLDGVIGASISDVSGAGFTRAMLELAPGTRNVDLQEIWSRGDSNALLLARSAMDVTIESFGSLPTPNRCNANGVPRALLTFRNRCTAVRVSDGDLVGGCVGIRIWGGHHIHLSGVTIRDMHNKPCLDRDSEVSSYRAGVGIDTGAGPLEIAEFAYDVTFDDIHLENCRQPALEHIGAWYLHDIMGLTISNCSISNKGLSPWEPDNLMTGMLASDCMGTIESLTVRGVNYAFHTINVLAFLKVSHLDIFGSPGSGAVGAYGLVLEHAHQGGGPSIDRLTVENRIRSADRVAARRQLRAYDGARRCDRWRSGHARRGRSSFVSGARAG